MTNRTRTIDPIQFLGVLISFTKLWYHNQVRHGTFLLGLPAGSAYVTACPEVVIGFR